MPTNNDKRLLSHSYCGSGIRKWLSLYTMLAQSLMISAWAVVIRRQDWGRRNFLHCGPLTSWYWPLAESLKSLFLQASQRSTRYTSWFLPELTFQEKARQRGHVFCDLASKAARHYFYHVLSIGSKTWSLAHIAGKGD